MREAPSTFPAADAPSSLSANGSRVRGCKTQSLLHQFKILCAKDACLSVKSRAAGKYSANLGPYLPVVQKIFVQKGGPRPPACISRTRLGFRV